MRLSRKQQRHLVNGDRITRVCISANCALSCRHLAIEFTSYTIYRKEYPHKPPLQDPPVPPLLTVRTALISKPKFHFILTRVQTSNDRDSVDEIAMTQDTGHVVSDVTDTRPSNRLHAAAPAAVSYSATIQ